MKNTLFHHVTRHAKALGCHIHKHHKKYLFGIFGGFALVKTMFVLLAGFGITTMYHTTFADQETGCVMTGQQFTGQTQTCTTIPGYLTGGTEDCTVTQEGYYTGGTLDDSGNLVDQTYVDPVQNCVLTGQYYTGEYQTCELTGGYWTGGTLVCPDTGNISQLANQQIVANGICDSNDIQWTTSLSGAILTGTIPFQRSYLTTDCMSAGAPKMFTLQLRDHNQQWVSLGTISSVATGFNFNSLLLSGTTNASGLVISGLYTVWNASGVITYTGVASGVYLNAWTGYKVRLLDQAGLALYTGDTFTIDNSIPTITGMILSSDEVVSGPLGLGAEVQLVFTASEELSGVVVNIGGTGATLQSKDGLTYTYTQVLSSGFSDGLISYTIAYTDLAGNVGSTMIRTGGLTFDKTAPVVSSLQLTGSLTGGMGLSFTTNELARFTLHYQLPGGDVTSWTATSYQTGNEYLFSGLQANTGYVFQLSVSDVVGNAVNYSGSFLVSSTGTITFHYALYTTGSNLTGDLAQLATTLKDEINKFNACKSGIVYNEITLNIGKNTYTLNMPTFKKDTVKTIVNAFTLLIMNKVEKDTKLTTTEVTEITKKFDNFLVILKLIRDDDNSCKQNLSTYHITQFTHAMQEYNLDVGE